MYCTNCGNEIPGGTKFCPNCGANQNIPLNTNRQNTPKKAIGDVTLSDLQWKPPKKKKSPWKIIGLVLIVILFVSGLGRIGKTYEAINEKRSASNTEITPSAEPTPSTEPTPSAEPALEEKKTSGTDTPDASEPEQEIVDSGLVTPEFKEMMDSYEAWFDDYIEFMQNYETSDDPVSMMQQYSEFLLQYADVMKKLNAVNQNELSPADAAYYLEVTARIYQKLAAIE